jgi:recombination DNA repair RAD52 pathway protein
MNFFFERQEREFICDLYDDKGPGYFSPIGYNRDLLASHMISEELEDQFFVIKDPIVMADIKNRIDYIKKFKMKPPKFNAPDVNYAAVLMRDMQQKPTTIEEIEKQLADLLKLKDDLSLLTKEKADEVTSDNKSQPEVKIEPETPQIKEEVKEDVKVAAALSSEEFEAEMAKLEDTINEVSKKSSKSRV